MKGTEIILAIILWGLVICIILAMSNWSDRQSYYPERDNYFDTYTDY